jgi:hypothetical protein
MSGGLRAVVVLYRHRVQQTHGAALAALCF